MPRFTSFIQELLPDWMRRKDGAAMPRADAVVPAKPPRGDDSRPAPEVPDEGRKAGRTADGR